MVSWYPFFPPARSASPWGVVGARPLCHTARSATHAPSVQQQQRGFSLFELMITVAIAGVLLAVGLPSMQGFIHGHSAGNEAEELASAIRLARSESMKRGMPVSLCPSSNPDANSPACGAAADWLKGWVTFTDEQNNGTLDEGDKVLKVHSVLGSVSAISEGNGADVISFLANGLAGRGTAKFTVQPKGNAESEAYKSNIRTLCLSNMGRITVYKGDESCS